MGALSILGSLLGPITDLASEFIEDKDKKNEFIFKLKNALNKADENQTNINIEAAKSPSIFVAGARPFILWGCGVGLLWTTLVAPFITYFMVIGGVDPSVIVSLPQPDLSLLTPVLLGLLGLGGLRTYEKKQGISRNNLN